MVDGGSYGVELAEEVVRDRWGSWGLGLDGGGEVVERQNVGGYHCQKKHKIETHCETHFLKRSS